MKKLTRTEIRRLINEEISLMNRPRRRSLASLMFEETAQAATTPSGGGMVSISDGPDKVIAAVQQLVADPAKRAMLLAGLTDGDPKDEVVTITPGKRAASTMVPTQSEIGSSQSLDDQIKDLYGNLDNAIKGGRINSKEGAFPVLTFGKFILDGHHRWSQAYATNPNAVLETAEISAPGVTDAKSALGLTHAILFALYGKSPTKPFKGENLFSMDDEKVKSYVKANIVDSALKKLADAKLIPSPDKDAAAELYARNLAELKKTPGQYSRTVMPQPLDAGDTKGLTEVPPDAAAGKVNFNNPKPEDVKKESASRSDQLVMERWQKLAGILKG